MLCSPSMVVNQKLLVTFHNTVTNIAKKLWDWSLTKFRRISCNYQRWSRDTRLEAKDSLSEDRHSRGQGQECSRPRTGMLEAKAKDQGHKRKCSPKKKKKGLHKNFSGDLQKKKASQKFFRRSPQKNVFHKILTIQKILLSSSRGQANFRGLEASRPRPRTSKCVLDAKDVLEDSTSGSYTINLWKQWLLNLRHNDSWIKLSKLTQL